MVLGRHQYLMDADVCEHSAHDLKYYKHQKCIVLPLLTF
jgi:hypothetical protein